jgi:hypothetical protein
MGRLESATHQGYHTQRGERQNTHTRRDEKCGGVRNKDGRKSLWWVLTPPERQQETDRTHLRGHEGRERIVPTRMRVKWR